MIDTGHTAWVLASSALVLFMLPGLALFYGGLVPTKNVGATMIHSFMAIALPEELAGLDISQHAGEAYTTE